MNNSIALGDSEYVEYEFEVSHILLFTLAKPSENLIERIDDSFVPENIFSTSEEFLDRNIFA